MIAISFAMNNMSMGIYNNIQLHNAEPLRFGSVPPTSAQPELVEGPAIWLAWARVLRRTGLRPLLRMSGGGAAGRYPA